MPFMSFMSFEIYAICFIFARILAYCSRVLQQHRPSELWGCFFTSDIRFTFLDPGTYCIPSRPCWIKSIRQRYICLLAEGKLPWFWENEVFFSRSQQLKRFCQFQLCPCVCRISILMAGAPSYLLKFSSNSGRGSPSPGRAMVSRY